MCNQWTDVAGIRIGKGADKRLDIAVQFNIFWG
jgi:hypothetical protein